MSPVRVTSHTVYLTDSFSSWVVASAQQDASSDFQVVGVSADPANASMGVGQTSVMGSE